MVSFKPSFGKDYFSQKVSNRCYWPKLDFGKFKSKFKRLIIGILSRLSVI